MTKKFKPQFLYDNKQMETQMKDQYARSISALKDLQEQAEILIEGKLSDVQLKEMMAEPKAFTESVKDSIRASFPHPRADDNFNLQAVGKSFDNINLTANKIHGETICQIKDGELFPNPKELKRLADESKVYTRNQRQNEALEKWGTVAKNINELCASGLANTSSLHKFKSISKGIISHGYKDGQLCVVMNHQQLLQIS